MSNYTKHKTTIMPKITQSLRMDNRNLNEKKSLTRKEDPYFAKNSNLNNPELLENERKPGTSIDRKKPIYVFPKITPSKAPPSTASSVNTGNQIPIYKINKINIIKSKNQIYDETDKDEKIHNNYENNMNYEINNNNINLNQVHPSINNNNEFVEEKKIS